jgi:protein involved in polysaccharide export with SLBB domain
MKQRAVKKPRWRQPASQEHRAKSKEQRVKGNDSTLSAIRNPQSTMSLRVWIYVVVFVSFSVVVCFAQTTGQEPTAQPPVTAPMLVTPGSGYRLHQGDKIEVKFFYQPELNQAAVVKPDGMISLQLIGDVPAEGLTPRELEQRLVQRYAPILIDPSISVIVTDYVKPRIFVGGEVAKPGPYELRDGDSLAQALVLAGGLTPRAHRKQVIHARLIGEGQMRVTVIDTTKLYAKNPDPDLNLTLRDGDLVYVPESKLSRLSDILSALRVQTFGMFTDPFNSR